MKLFHTERGQLAYDTLKRECDDVKLDSYCNIDDNAKMTDVFLSKMQVGVTYVENLSKVMLAAQQIDRDERLLGVQVGMLTNEMNKE